MSARTRLGYAAGVLTLGLGLFALLAPYWMILLLGFEFSTARPWGVTELRATYGALFVALGGVMIWALPLRPRSAPYLRVAALLWLAAAFGRVLGIVLDGTVLPLNILALLLALLIGGAALLAAQERPRLPAPRPNDPSDGTHETL